MIMTVRVRVRVIGLLFPQADPHCIITHNECKTLTLLEGQVKNPMCLTLKVRLQIRLRYLRVYENGCLWELNPGVSDSRLNALAR